MSAVTIKESRRLLLPLETVLEALVHFDRRSNGPLSRGDVLQADFVTDQESGDAIEVATRMPGGGDIEWLRFDFGAIAAAIISYCRAKRIPALVRREAIALTKEGISFTINLSGALHSARSARGYRRAADSICERIRAALVKPSGENVAIPALTT
jgi:hypothetical protein